MRDRIQFFQTANIGDKEFDSVITTLFDQFSALYNLAGNFDINRVSQKDSTVEFDISTPNSDDVSTLYRNISTMSTVFIYEKSFYIRTELIDSNNIRISFTENTY
jgi:hypothetical protein